MPPGTARSGLASAAKLSTRALEARENPLSPLVIRGGGRARAPSSPVPALAPGCVWPRPMPAMMRSERCALGQPDAGEG